MSLVMFLSHGQQEFCLTKQLALISSTGFCICIVLAALTPCARRPFGRSGDVLLSWQDQQSVYSAQMTQSGLVAIYMTFWVWSAMQSAPEDPGFVELAFIVDENDLTCIVGRNYFVEQALTYTAVIMMLFTVVYIGSSQSDVKKPNSVSGISENFINCVNPGEARPQRACLCYAHSVLGASAGNGNATGSSISSGTASRRKITFSDRVIKDESLRTTYSYSLLHFTLALATMFATTQVKLVFMLVSLFKNLTLHFS